MSNPDDQRRGEIPLEVSAEVAVPPARPQVTNTRNALRRRLDTAMAAAPSRNEIDSLVREIITIDGWNRNFVRMDDDYLNTRLGDLNRNIRALLAPGSDHLRALACMADLDEKEHGYSKLKILRRSWDWDYGDDRCVIGSAGSRGVAVESPDEARQIEKVLKPSGVRLMNTADYSLFSARFGRYEDRGFYNLAPQPTETPLFREGVRYNDRAPGLSSLLETLIAAGARAGGVVYLSDDPKGDKITLGTMVSDFSNGNPHFPSVYASTITVGQNELQRLKDAGVKFFVRLAYDLEVKGALL